MPSAKQKAARAAADSDDEHGEGYMRLETDSPGTELQTSKQPSARGRRKAAAAQQQQEPEPADQGSSRVVYIGNLPHGFYEKQLLGFFSQFGKVTKVRLSRNKKTGKAKHYAFLEFQYPDVAKIACDAMNGYFMFKQKLTCRLLAPDRVHPLLFQGANRKFRDIPWRKLERQRHDKERSPEEQAKRIARLVKRDRQRQARIKAAGIDFEYAGLASSLPVKPKKIKIL